MSVLAAVLSIAACGHSGGDSAGVDGNANPDLDGDGFHAGADCNDSDAAVNPDATEVCDGIDNDCDGDVDVDAVDLTIAWYDGDRDGFGAGAPQPWCGVPEGTVTRDGDCDDTRSDVNPDAPEVCDPKNVDEDCDSVADDNDPSAGNFLEFYVDADGDGYGVDDTTPVIGCDAPPGYATLPGDCDDTNSNVSPATVEVCGDTVDEDCDGSTSCALHGDVSIDEADLTLTGVLGGEGLYHGLAAGDVDGNGVADLVAESGRGMALFLGPLTKATLDSAVASVSWYPTGSVHDALSLGDQDGDGYDDLAFLSLDYDMGDGPEGRAFVFLGPIEGTLVDAEADATVTGDRKRSSSLGQWSSAGDVDGDGIVDSILGASKSTYWNDINAYLFLGPMTIGDRDAGDADAWLYGSNWLSDAGGEVCADGDLDGDGVDDVLITALNEDNGRGAGWVFRGPVLGDNLFADADVTITGANDHLGWRATTRGDLDADGTEDVVIAEYPYAGLVTLYVLSGADVTSAGEISISAADAVIEPDPTAYAGEPFGYVTESGGDVDGDGIDDLVVTDFGTPGGGNLWGFAGPLSGALATSDATFVMSSGPTDYFGDYAAVVPDVTGDGFDDLVASDLTSLTMYVYVFAAGP